MKFLRLFCILFIASLSSCTNSASDTLIARNQLGLLTEHTSILELSSILVKDSIPKIEDPSQLKRISEIEVFNQEGRISLIIEPKYSNDTTATINEIQILDPKYKTKKGVNIDSTFKSIYENYKITNIQNTINSVIISISEIGAYLVIDKKHLPSELRFDSELKIEANQIPDDAPLKYFWLKFDKSES